MRTEAFGFIIARAKTGKVDAFDNLMIGIAELKRECRIVKWFVLANTATLIAVAIAAVVKIIFAS